MESKEARQQDSGRVQGRSAQIAPAAFSIPEFCEAHRISRALFYIIQKEGTGPRVMRVRGRTLVTADAAAEWRQQMESVSAS